MNKMKMINLNKIVKLFLFIFILTSFTNTVLGATTYYVSITGNDSNDCTSIVTPCGTIQGAINKSSDGDSVNVSDGTYDEQVIINKEIILQGTGNTTIIKPSSASKLTTVLDGLFWNGTPNTKQIAGIIVANISEGGNVTIKNLKVDESNITTKPTGADYITGIFYRETGGKIDNISVVGGGAWSGSDQAYGIYLSATTKMANMEISTSTITNYDKNGIEAMGDKLMFNIYDNTITGRGPTLAGDEVQNGINAGRNSIGTISNNRISNLTYKPETWWAAAILFGDSNGSARDNNITTCQIGVIFQDGNGSAQGNTVSGGTVGLIGLWAQYTKAGTWMASFSNNIVSGANDSPGYENGAIGAQAWNENATIKVIIDNNQIISTEPTSADGIYIGDIPAYSPAGSIKPTITNNIISGWEHGIHLVSSVSDANISNNRIINNVLPDSGIHIDAEINVADIHVNFNDIVGNLDYGIYNNGTGILNATYNYWGSCDGPGLVGPGSGDNVSVNISYYPWLGVCIENKTEITCKYERDNITLSADVSSLIDIKSVWISYTINGTNYNKTPAKGAGNSHYYIINSTDLVGGKNITWNVFVEDQYGKVYNNSWKTFYVINTTRLTTDPPTPDGINEWYVSEPLFTLSSDGGASTTWYRWDSTPNITYTHPFNLTDIPNPPPESAGTLELTYWSSYPGCDLEEEESEIFYIDLVSPMIKIINPLNNSVVTANGTNISALLDEKYGSNSGINSSSIIMKIDNNTTKPIIVTVADLNKKIYNFTILSEGIHNVSIFCMDNSGRASYKEWSFRINSTPGLEMNITSPENKSYNKRMIPINITLNGEADSIEYSIDQKRFTRFCTRCSSYYRQRFSFSEGYHNLTIRAKKDLYAISQNISILIDSKEPHIYGVIPARNGTHVNESVVFSVKFREDFLKDVRMFYGSENNLKNQTTTDCEFGKSTTTCYTELNFSGYGNDTAEYYFTVSDSLNTTESKHYKVNIDRKAPDMNISSPENKTYYTTGYNVKIHFNITTDEPVRLDYSENGKSFRELCRNCKDYRKEKSFRTGSYLIVFRAIDITGKITTEQRNFIISKLEVVYTQ